MKDVYLYALGGNLSFALGSMIFTHYARKVSSIWMNFIKGNIALVCFALVISMGDGWNALIPTQGALFFLSGLLGLGLGDIYLLKGFSELGPGRSLMVFGFQPLMIGILSYIFLGQSVDSNQLIAILFLITCLYIFSLERYKANGHWDHKGLIHVLMGVSLDAVGVLLTRAAFDMNDQTTVWEGNFYRCVGAIVFMLVLGYVRPFGIIENLKKQSTKGKVAITGGALLGTFLALSLSLRAVQTGHLASIAALGVTGSLFSSILECVHDKKWPSPYLLVAFLLFLIGSRFMLA